MHTKRELPKAFLDTLDRLEKAYLSEDDPIKQSGFSGGRVRWESERSPILDAVESDGKIIDLACANGYLLECLVKWAKVMGIDLVPFGLDQGSELIQLAKKRLPAFETHFYVGNSWNWNPPFPFRYAYTLYDCVPEDYLLEYIHRLLENIVSSDGRLIIGAYGSLSDHTAPFDILGFLESNGFVVSGSSFGGRPVVTAFAWMDRCDNP